MAFFPSIAKKFRAVKATDVDQKQAYDWTRAARGTSVATTLEDQGKLLTIPAYTLNYTPYRRQQLFQFNVTNTEPFYFINLAVLARSTYLAGGCLCVKYRVGTTVYRYKLLDYTSASDWSYFTPYTNQVIKENFCIEFYANALGVGDYGMLGTIPFLLSTKVSISEFDQGPDYLTVTAPPLLRSDIGVALPEDLPYNQPNAVWQTNA